MAHSIKILNLVATPNSNESRPEYTARGECNGRPFDAKTIIYQGAPIFKVQEEGDSRSSLIQTSLEASALLSLVLASSNSRQELWFKRTKLLLKTPINSP